MSTPTTTEDETAAGNVIEALSRVIRDLPGIGKDQQASAQQGGYRYRGIEAITREAGELFARHGIVFAPKLSRWHPRTDLTINGKPWTDERVEVTYTVYGPGGREDCIEVGPIPALGRDNSDKGTNKCLTQAFKYALIQTLCIGDAKDDADGQTHEVDQAPPPQPPEGFATWDEARDRIAALRSRIEGLAGELVEGRYADGSDALFFSEWYRKREYPWPWPAEVCDAIESKLNEITGPADVGEHPADSVGEGEASQQAPAEASSSSPEVSDDEPTGTQADPADESGGDATEDASSEQSGAPSEDASPPSGAPAAPVDPEELAGRACAKCGSVKAKRVLAAGGEVVCKNRHDCDVRVTDEQRPM